MMLDCDPKRNPSRRAIMKLAAGTVACWPFTLRAEDAAAPTIGFLDPRPSSDTFADQISGFFRGLRETGFVSGENLTIRYEWGNNRFENLPALAEKLERQSLAAMVASGGSNVALVAKSATTTTPIVFIIADDPVELGLVSSLARPGGNLTGINYFNVQLYAKRLELLTKLAPHTTRIAVLVNPNDAATMEATLRELKSSAQAMGLTLQILRTSTDDEITAAFAQIRDRSDALYVGGDVFLHSRRAQIVSLAIRDALPMAFPQREWAEAGGLMSYGTNFPDVYRQAGVYTGRILNGEKPSNLPVVQPSRFELVINLKTANALGVAIPGTLLALADEVIE
jgi:putative tryptophan/tyrosine transport system substrate-binding protein